MALSDASLDRKQPFDEDDKCDWFDSVTTDNLFSPFTCHLDGSLIQGN